jgi:O-antigen ligase
VRISSCQQFANEEATMDGNIVGFAAVVMVFAVPLAGIYAWYRVRRLRTEERLAAIARGVDVPMEPELSQAARSRRSGILLVAASLGYTIAMGLVARAEPDAWVAAAFGVIPFAVGLGFFLDSALIRRDLRA